MLHVNSHKAVILCVFQKAQRYIAFQLRPQAIQILIVWIVTLNLSARVVNSSNYYEYCTLYSIRTMLTLVNIICVQYITCRNNYRTKLECNKDSQYRVCVLSILQYQHKLIAARLKKGTAQ